MELYAYSGTLLLQTKILHIWCHCNIEVSLKSESPVARKPACRFADFLRSYLVIWFFNSPENCTWGEWSSWETCSQTCGGGSQIRTRSVSEQAKRGGSCPGQSSELQGCNTQLCPPGRLIIRNIIISFCDMALWISRKLHMGWMEQLGNLFPDLWWRKSNPFQKCLWTG